MARILGPVGELVHDAAAALIDNKIPQKISDSVTGFVSAGFGIVNDVLGIVRDLTKPEAAPGKPPQS
ncbi:MAG: hypothetical protein M0002_14910 [Rhodospirillales bacterium]|nr:hypothetical protein [Rhodospirillales bacterium]